MCDSCYFVDKRSIHKRRLRTNKCTYSLFKDDDGKVATVIKMRNTGSKDPKATTFFIHRMIHETRAWRNNALYFALHTRPAFALNAQMQTILPACKGSWLAWAQFWRAPVLFHHLYLYYILPALVSYCLSLFRLPVSFG